LLGLFVNGNAEIEAKMNAVERLDEFIKIDQEGKNALTNDNVNFTGWDLEFRDLNFAYKSGPVVLNNISFKVNHGEKVGIVGRTGSGMVLCLWLCCIYVLLFYFSAFG
jgi:ABC-type multidrug transport system fused ATPase/permease subunit